MSFKVWVKLKHSSQSRVYAFGTLAAACRFRSLQERNGYLAVLMPQ